MEVLGIPRRGERERDAPLARALIVMVGVASAVLAPLVLAALVFVVLPGLASRRAQARSRMRGDIQELRSAVLLHLGQEPGKPCPSIAALEQEGLLRPSRRTTDAWERPFRIACDGDDIFVVSDGPDGVAGTADDVD